jgi:hypothetical protein
MDFRLLFGSWDFLVHFTWLSLVGFRLRVVKNGYNIRSFDLTLSWDTLLHYILITIVAFIHAWISPRNLNTVNYSNLQILKWISYHESLLSFNIARNWMFVSSTVWRVLWKKKFVCMCQGQRSKVKKKFSMIFYFRAHCRKNMVLVGIKSQKNIVSFRVQRSKQHLEGECKWRLIISWGNVLEYRSD